MEARLTVKDGERGGGQAGQKQEADDFHGGAVAASVFPGEAAAWQGPYVFEGRDRLLESGSGLDLGTNQVSPPHFPILYTFLLGNWNFWETS